ncbi:MAG: hypothetical protein M1368_02210 [Thaumarchaeota archaeon]|nr:hypothetical protein [Nitrososphaerota archaeon]
MIVRYVGLARSFSGVDEDIISEKVNSLADVVAILSARHKGRIQDALASNGYTHLGHLMIEMEGKSIDLKDMTNISISESSEVSVLIIPTVVGG